jgi:hypothetical protein
MLINLLLKLTNAKILIEILNKYYIKGIPI